MLNYLPRYLKLTLITGLLACISHLAYAGSQPPPTLEGVNKFKYKVGATGPGGGFIFFVDYFDQYRGFTYLEAAPTDASGSSAWCNDDTNSIAGAAGDAAKAVGRGRANTVAMLGGCSSGAAIKANSYIAPNGKDDWFLPSLGEAMLMYTNLLQAGVGGVALDYYWSSTEDSGGSAWHQDFFHGGQYYLSKNSTTPRVRAVRAF